jgi:hypothetical protein
MLNSSAATLHCIRGIAVFGILLMVNGCFAVAVSYIDPTLPPASAADVRPANHATAIQLLVEFRANDVPNAQVTSQVQAQMLDIARQSGLFSKIGTDPVDGRRRLVIIINDYAGPQKGSPIATGLTYGLAGTEVTDRYHCEVRYDAPGHTPITLAYEHALISTIGVAFGPSGLTPYSPGTASHKVFDQLGWSIMRDLAAKGATEA